MKKEIKKSKGMPVFKKLSLGAAICGFIAAICMLLWSLGVNARIDVLDEISKFTAIGTIASLFVMLTLFVAQAVEGRFYGDVFGKMTKNNATIILCVLACASLVMLALSIVIGSGILDLRGRIERLMSGIFSIFALLATLGYSITSTLIVAKGK